MMPNQLFLQRLRIITQEGAVAYDEVFHKGVNIIRGDNSSGKSTITHFIFYALGGAFNDFVPEARQCSIVYAEVEMNGAIFTIRRNLEEDEKGNLSKLAPLYFFWDNLNSALNPTEGQNWQRFGYQTTQKRKSFSNVIFENLNFPEVKGDSNITIHQILRLLYIDQESPTSSLFYYEYFDSQFTRETVAELLLGYYSERLYEIKKRLIDAEKELDELKGRIKATSSFFPDNLSLDPIHIKAQIQAKEDEIKIIQNKIIEIRKEETEIIYKKNDKLNFQVLQDQSLAQRKRVLELKDKIEYIDNDILDTQFFVETLNNKIKAINNSITTREFLGNIPLEYCPDCLNKLDAPQNETTCKLCKGNIDDSFGISQARRMTLEITFQIKESQQVLEDSKAKALELKSKYKTEIEKLNHLQKQVNEALIDVKSVKQEQSDRLNADKGFVEGEILQFYTMLENAELFASLLKNKADLTAEIEKLKFAKGQEEQRQSNIKREVEKKIKEEALYLLNNDFDRQDEFKNANEFYIDFSNNIAYLSNKYSKYSASSNFYLKVTARFAIFLASLSKSEMRFPRFIFADNMEDKGIEKERAQNLQEILIKRANDFDSENYQMIYTTSYITDELNSSDYVVGEYYTKANPSLQNIIKD
jgi:hypothetical protein